MTITIYKGEAVWTKFDTDHVRQQRHISPAMQLLRKIFDWQNQPGCTRIVIEDGDGTSVEWARGTDYVRSFPESSLCPSCRAAWNAYDDRCPNPQCGKT